MGQVVLVPPKTLVTKPTGGYGTDMAPVMFSPHPPIQDGCVIQASVPVPKMAEIVNDPMSAYMGLVNFGRWQVGSRDTKNPCGAYWQGFPTQLTYDELRTKFWDFSEIQDFVRANLVGDLLAQYDEGACRWSFITCHQADHAVWQTRVSQHKAVEFALDYRLKDRVETWLKAECGIFDIVETRGYGGNYPVRVYVKDPEEALYFKMRWSGIDVERELAEPT